MGLGVITGSLSIVRTVLNWQNETSDPTWASIPNWYWRSWEVFFGIAAACIPTLRPGYKWLKGAMRTRFTKLSSGQEKGTEEPVVKWTAPKPSASDPSKGSRGNKHNTEDSMATTTTTQEEDILPLHNFEPSIRADIENYPRGDETEERQHYPRDSNGNERRTGLHIPGDLSTNRPGHFKRLDSEAKVGGGLGAEEVEDRI